MPAERGFRLFTLAEGLEHPWGMVWLPNSDILITERPGRLRLVRDGQLIPDPVSGVSEVFASGQGGLLDVSLHPRFNQTRKLYFTYAHGTAKANRTRVATAIAPSGLTIYTGDKFPDWYGDVFAGGLKSQDIRRIDLDNAGNVIGQYALRIGQRVRDIRQGPDGMLCVLTDESHGSLIRLEPTSDRDSPEAP